jgi:hypothetical protein
LGWPSLWLRLTSSGSQPDNHQHVMCHITATPHSSDVQGVHMLHLSECHTTPCHSDTPLLLIDICNTVTPIPGRNPRNTGRKHHAATSCITL